MRIVSLLPSATEIICTLGLQDALVGVTHECDYPQGVAGLPVVTKTIIPHDASSLEIDKLVRTHLQTEGTLYSLKTEVLEQLAPDLLVTQSLCDVCAVSADEIYQTAARLSCNPEIINLAPRSLSDLFATIHRVAEKTGTLLQGKQIVSALQKRVNVIKNKTDAEIPLANRPKVVFLEWIDPPFCPGHWNAELLELAGGIECFDHQGKAARAVSWEQITALEPELIFIACCGFDLDRAERDIDIVLKNTPWQDRPIYISDGNAYFSRPGPRLVDSLEILAHTLHPEIHSLPAHLESATQIR